MSFRLDMDGPTRKLVRHLPPERKRRIREALREIARDPAAGKVLQEELTGLHSYRVGTLRIVYSIDVKARIVRIVAIGPRRNVYEELERTRRRRRR